MNFFKSPLKDIDNTKKCHFNVFYIQQQNYFQLNYLLEINCSIIEKN